jgi:hypothetical protein
MKTNELGVEVTLKKSYPLVKETLERMGIRNSQDKKFFPSCYCVEENDTFRIYHFKELFIKDGNESTYNDLDELRRNTIIHFLKKWEFIDTDYKIEEILVKKIDVLNHEDKHNFRICHKYFFKRQVN